MASQASGGRGVPAAPWTHDGEGGQNGGVEDPFAVLGISEHASPEEVTAAYRRLAKRLHPDIAGQNPAAAERMTHVNAAYDVVRNGALRASVPADRRAPSRAGAWLAESVRSALGGELLGALESQEWVALSTPVSTWASPRALLAVTDRRLLWLHDDAVMGRVRSLRYRDIAAAELRLSWPRRRRATLRLRGRDGRRYAFAGLRPAVGRRIVRVVRAR